MIRPTLAPQPPLRLAVCDAAAILAFVTIGLFSHHRGLSLEAYARDSLTLGGGWFAAAVFLHTYRDQDLGRLLATWACGIPAGVLLRALVLGRALDGSQAAFLAVCFVTIGALVLILRGLLRLAESTRLQA
jgi:Protein of unknown function (DUF3054)